MEDESIQLLNLCNEATITAHIDKEPECNSESDVGVRTTKIEYLIETNAYSKINDLTRARYFHFRSNRRRP